MAARHAKIEYIVEIIAFNVTAEQDPSRYGPREFCVFIGRWTWEIPSKRADQVIILAQQERALCAVRSTSDRGDLIYSRSRCVVYSNAAKVTHTPHLLWRVCVLPNLCGCGTNHIRMSYVLPTFLQVDGTFFQVRRSGTTARFVRTCFGGSNGTHVFLKTCGGSGKSREGVRQRTSLAR